MPAFAAPPFERLADAVLHPSRPIAQRMRAAYYLKQAYGEAGGEQPGSEHQARVIEVLGEGLKMPGHGGLMRHEFAYVLGQMQDSRACDVLEGVLSNTADDCMVRHECAEALGAIGDPRSLACLRLGVSDASPEVAETCEIALEYLQWKVQDNGTHADKEAPRMCACMSPYSSEDPAPPHPAHAEVPTAELGRRVQDADMPLFERYRCMFSLRNRGGEDAVLALGHALATDHSSALLRHELAFVLGQMQHPAAVEPLASSLRREGEHHMVRHEAAEALGAIDGRWQDCEQLLREFRQDPDDVVRESCEVALDAADYFGLSSGAQEDAMDDLAAEPESGEGGHPPGFAAHKATGANAGADEAPGSGAQGDRPEGVLVSAVH